MDDGKLEVIYYRDGEYYKAILSKQSAADLKAAAKADADYINSTKKVQGT